MYFGRLIFDKPCIKKYWGRLEIENDIFTVNALPVTSFRPGVEFDAQRVHVVATTGT